VGLLDLLDLLDLLGVAFLCRLACRLLVLLGTTQEVRKLLEQAFRERWASSCQERDHQRHAQVLQVLGGPARALGEPFLFQQLFPHRGQV